MRLLNQSHLWPFSRGRVFNKSAALKEPMRPSGVLDERAGITNERAQVPLTLRMIDNSDGGVVRRCVTLTSCRRSYAQHGLSCHARMFRKRYRTCTSTFQHIHNTITFSISTTATTFMVVVSKFLTPLLPAPHHFPCPLTSSYIETSTVPEHTLSPPITTI